MLSIDSQILLIFSAFGAINGFLVSIYLFMQKSRVLENRFLALMVLMLSVRIFKSVLFYFNPDTPREILQAGLSACFLIGPFAFYSVYFHVYRQHKFVLFHKIHLAVLLLLIAVAALWFPYASHPELWGVLYKLINYTWLGYLLLSCWIARHPLKMCFQTVNLLDNQNSRLLVVLLGNAVVWIAYFTSSYTSYIVGALSFSFLLLITLLLIMTRKESTEEATKYGDKKIDSDESVTLKMRLDQLMTQEALYKNANLTMPQLAKRMGMSVPRFSQLLNDNLNKSFPQFVNEYRVNEAKSLLTAEKSLTMDVVSEMCGFNSQSTFYTAFKKHTDMTPAKYKSRISASNTTDL